MHVFRFRLKAFSHTIHAPSLLSRHIRVFDVEFEIESLQIFDLVRCGKIICILSDVTETELIIAPEKVRQFLLGLNQSSIERVRATPESITLAETYINEGVVGATSRDDCLHIATATVHAADALLSWNFKHIVNA